MRLALLAMLADRSAYGYELKQRLERLLGPAYPPHNIGQFYVTLRRLEKSGLVEGEDETQACRPNRRVYRLTEAGREAVAAWFDQPVEQPRLRSEFFVKLALAPRTGLTDPIALIHQQRRQHLLMLRDLSKLVEEQVRSVENAPAAADPNGGRPGAERPGEPVDEGPGDEGPGDEGPGDEEPGSGERKDDERDRRIAGLLIEGAMLHLQADLDWLERCQQELE